MITSTIQSKFVRAEVQTLGAMVGPAWFTLGGVEVQPFAVAPWAGDTGPSYDALPNILKRLRGEWACVPFGIERNLSELPRDWQPEAGEAMSELVPHGLSSNEDWQITRLSSDRIELALEYPEPHSVRLLKRTISASGLKPQLDLSLTVEVREPCEFPMGLHPTFRLPAVPRRAILTLDPAAQVWTSPLALEPVTARFRADIRGVAANRVPLLDGSDEDITHLPLPYAAEEVVLATGLRGHVTVQNLDDQYTVALSWDPSIFPGCQLWLSNGGRSYYPWNSRFLALGVEPVRAAFDLGTQVSRNRSNPLWRAGLPCTISLLPVKPFKTAYSITVS